MSVAGSALASRSAPGSATEGGVASGSGPGAGLRLRVIGCEVLARPLAVAAARSRHEVHISFLERRLHDRPITLRERLQEEVDEAAAGDPTYDAIVLAYGLCGGSTVGIRAPGIPLVVPRAHDCVTLLLGSRTRYDLEITRDPGTYWFSAEYADRADPSGPGGDGALGLGAPTEAQLAEVFDSYVARFGRENAEYLIQVLGAWRDHYDRAVFLDLGLPDPDDVEGVARAEAGRHGWRFERMAGELDLLCRLLDGNWADDALVLAPGQRLAMSFDPSVVAAVDDPASGGPG